MIESADSIQILLSSQLEEEEAKTDQIKQSGVLVNIQPPEQAQIFAQEELKKTVKTQANPKYKIRRCIMAV